MSTRAVARLACALPLFAIVACSHRANIWPLSDADVDADVDATIDATDFDRVPADAPPTDVDRVSVDAGHARCGLANLACDPIDNRGCERGTECRLLRTGGDPWRAECLPAATSVDGTPCATTADCGLGYLCRIEAAGGRCRPLCCVGDPFDGFPRCAAAPRAMCELPHRFCTTRFGAGNLALCEAEGDCSPWLRNTCRVGQHCVPVAPDGSFGCIWYGRVPDGEPCMSLSDCIEGSTCVMTPGTSAPHCRPLCDPTVLADAGAPPCPSDRPRSCALGARCVALRSAEIPLGACVP